MTFAIFIVLGLYIVKLGWDLVFVLLFSRLMMFAYLPWPYVAFIVSFNQELHQPWYTCIYYTDTHRIRQATIVYNQTYELGTNLNFVGESRGLGS